MVARHREAARFDVTFGEMISFAYDEGEALRSRQAAIKLPKGILPRTAHAIHFVDEDSVHPSTFEGYAEIFGLLPDLSQSADDSALVSTMDDASDGILYGERSSAPSLP